MTSISFPVPTSTVGRIDHSMEVASSVTPITPNQQVNVSASFIATLPTLPYPFVFFQTLILSRSLNGAIPPGHSIIGLDINISGDTNATSVIGAQVYDRYDPATDTLDLTSLFDTIFLKYAPRTAEVRANRGFETVGYAGKYLVLLFAHYSVNPFSTIAVNIYGMLDRNLLETERVQ